MFSSHKLKLYNVIRLISDEHTPYMDIPERASTWYTYEEALAAAKRNLLDEWDINIFEKYEETTDGSGENASSDGFQAYALFPDGEEMWVYIEEVVEEGSVGQTHDSNQTTKNSNATIPTISPHNQIDDNSLFANISEYEAGQISRNNKTIQEIISDNILSKVSAEVQKVKDEHAKILTDVNQKAVLEINMTEDRIRVVTGKLQLIEHAAHSTPERAVAEVWAEANKYEPPWVPSTLASDNSHVCDSGGRGQDLNMKHVGLTRRGSNMGPKNSPGLSGSKRPRDDASTSEHIENIVNKRSRGE